MPIVIVSLPTMQFHNYIMTKLEQLKEVSDKINLLSNSQEIVFGNNELELIGAEKEKGAFISPTLFVNKNPFTKSYKK